MQILSIFRKTRVQVWWNHLIAPLCFPIYLYFYQIGEFKATPFVLFLMSSASLALFGFFINDFYDREPDKKAGKSNFFQKISKFWSVLILVITFLLCIMLWNCISTEKVLLKWLIVSIEIILFFLYSGKAFRLKEHAWGGIILDSLYGHVLPFVAAIVIFPLNIGKAGWLLVLLWQFVLGLRNILSHQLEDLKNDLMSETKTFVFVKGKEVTQKLIGYLGYLEVLIFLLFAIFLAISICLEILIIMVVSFLVILIYTVKKKRSDPTVIFVFNNVYEITLPIISVVWVSIKLGSYPSFLMHVILFSYSYYKLLKMIEELKFYPSSSSFKVAINHIVYYLFKLFGVDLKKENKSAVEYLKFKLFRG